MTLDFIAVILIPGSGLKLASDVDKLLTSRHEFLLATFSGLWVRSAPNKDYKNGPIDSLLDAQSSGLKFAGLIIQ